MHGHATQHERALLFLPLLAEEEEAVRLQELAEPGQIRRGQAREGELLLGEHALDLHPLEQAHRLLRKLGRQQVGFGAHRELRQQRREARAVSLLHFARSAGAGRCDRLDPAPWPRSLPRYGESIALKP